MDAEHENLARTASVSMETARLVEPFRAALLALDEPQRYRLLASLLVQMADGSPGRGNGSKAVAPDRQEAMAKKLQALDQERATLDDQLRTTKADLERRGKQLDAEQTRGQELHQLVEEQRRRYDALRKDVDVLEAEVVAKNAALHQAEVQVEDLTLKLQRAAMETPDYSKVDAWEKEKRELTARIEELQAANEQLRLDKDADIERMKDDLRESRTAATEEGGAVLAGLWERLAAASPPLAEGHVPPNLQAAQRLTDAFIELVKFVHDFDKSIRVFLGQYTKDHPTVRVPWDAYTKGDDFRVIVQRTVAPKGGRPVGVLKMRLRLLYSWIEAAMVGSDSAVASIASELESYLRGPSGAGSDRNKKILDFLRDDGHELFLQHMRELRSTKLAEAFGRGG